MHTTTFVGRASCPLGSDQAVAGQRPRGINAPAGRIGRPCPERSLPASLRRWRIEKRMDRLDHLDLGDVEFPDYWCDQANQEALQLIAFKQQDDLVVFGVNVGEVIRPNGIQDLLGKRLLTPR